MQPLQNEHRLSCTDSLRWNGMETTQYPVELWISHHQITHTLLWYYTDTAHPQILCLSVRRSVIHEMVDEFREMSCSFFSLSISGWMVFKKIKEGEPPPKTNLFAASSHRFGLYANCRNSLDVFTCGFSWVKKYTVRATGEYSLTSDVPFSVKIIMYCSTNVEVESLSWQKVLGTVLLHQQFGVIVKLKNEAVARWKANLTVLFCVYTSPITTGSNAAPNHDTAFLTVSWPPTYTSTINWIKMSNLGSSLHKTCYHWLSWG